MKCFQKMMCWLIGLVSILLLKPSIGLADIVSPELAEEPVGMTQPEETDRTRLTPDLTVTANVHYETEQGYDLAAYTAALGEARREACRKFAQTLNEQADDAAKPVQPDSLWGRVEFLGRPIMDGQGRVTVRARLRPTDQQVPDYPSSRSNPITVKVNTSRVHSTSIQTTAFTHAPVLEGVQDKVAAKPTDPIKERLLRGHTKQSIPQTKPASGPPVQQDKSFMNKDEITSVLENGKARPLIKLVKSPSKRATGLVIDARGIGFEPVMTPRLLGPEGQVLLDIERVNMDRMAEMGMVGYATTMNEALEDPRVGISPLVVKATRQSNQKIQIELNKDDWAALNQQKDMMDLISDGHIVILIEAMK